MTGCACARSWQRPTASASRARTAKAPQRNLKRSAHARPPSFAAVAPRKFLRRLANKPLAGRGIVVTRPRDQAAGLAALIEAAGGRALLYPAIEIEDLSDPASALRVIGNLEQDQLAGNNGEEPVGAFVWFNQRFSRLNRSDPSVGLHSRLLGTG